MNKTKKIITLLFATLFSKTYPDAVLKHYYCTPADQKHFHLVKNLIGSIHHNDCERLGEIAVFDLGFTKEQRDELSRMQFVKVYDVEITHPDLLKPILTCKSGRMVRGFFAWKPVVMKQALELFPYILYADAGTTILRPLDDLFEHINEHGYFLLSCTHNDVCSLAGRMTKTVQERIVNKLSSREQAIIAQAYSIDAGLQGLTRKMIDSYVMPMYKLTYDIDLFADDGTSRYGFGGGRHDQTLFTIYAHLLGLSINAEGASSLFVKGREIPIHTHWNGADILDSSIIYRSRHDLHFRGGMTQYIKYVK